MPADPCAHRQRAGWELDDTGSAAGIGKPPGGPGGWDGMGQRWLADKSPNCRMMLQRTPSSGGSSQCHIWLPDGTHMLLHIHILLCIYIYIYILLCIYTIISYIVHYCLYIYIYRSLMIFVLYRPDIHQYRWRFMKYQLIIVIHYKIASIYFQLHLSMFFHDKSACQWWYSLVMGRWPATACHGS